MRTLRFATLAALALVCGCEAATPQHPPLTGRTEEFSLRGVAVDDEFSIFVRLPAAYDEKPDARFPVVLQLDGNTPILEEFDVTAGQASDLEAMGRIPPTIVVGIGYPYSAQESNKGRNRDYTLPLKHPDTMGGTTSGGAPQFLAFLRDELVPALGARYRIQGPEGRALFGHSLGGLFVEFAFLNQDAAKPFVSGFVAASPSLWFDSGSIYGYFDEFKASHTEVPAILFSTVGGLEGPAMTVYFDDLSQRTREAWFSKLHFDTRTYGTDHMGTISPSFRDGLEFLFRNGLGVTP
ncbi:MAG: alpha/beta hydrolase-fold protein [Myxococcales bacterium]